MKKIYLGLIMACLLAVSLVQATDLEDYPEIFMEDGVFNGQIVVGDTSPAAHVLAAIDIAQGLEESADNNNKIKVSAAVLASEANVFKTNLIVIGNSCHNDVATILEGFPVPCDTNDDFGYGKIRYIKSNGYHHIIVSGQDDLEIRKAARILYEYDEHVLDGDEVLIGGNDFTSIYVKGFEPSENNDLLKINMDLEVENYNEPAKIMAECNIHGGDAPYDVSLVVDFLDLNNGKNKYVLDKSEDYYTELHLEEGRYDFNCQVYDDDGNYAVSSFERVNVASPVVEDVSPRDMQREPIYGDDNAPLTIIAYVGYNDPYTIKSFEVLDDVLDDFEDDVKLEIRNFPLSFQDKNFLEAQASECVLALSSENAFLRYIDNLMDSSNGDMDSVVREAVRVGVDEFQITECLSNEKYLPEVLDDIKDGKRDGVTGTPTFFIEGKKISGSQSYTVFAEIINEKLGNDYEAPTCQDGIKNQGESGIDCGGPCSYCAQDPIPSCRDGVQNQNESGVDCGGECETCYEDTTCNGCEDGGRCLQTGIRLLEDQVPVFCSLNGTLDSQKFEGALCQNNFECQSNQCGNGQCIDLQQELEETRGLLKSILDWFNKFLG